jgi:uncharacterized repeat protein (TIGR01451 family)
MRALSSVLRQGAFIAMCCLSFGALAFRATAEESSPELWVETTAEIRVHAANGDQFAPAERLRIGDEVFYTLRVRNTSASAVQDAIIVKALPRNTRYVPDSAVGPAASISYSVNGSNSFAVPEQLVVVMADGTSRAATADDYTHIRWELRHPLASGATALLRFRGVFK